MNDDDLAAVLDLVRRFVREQVVPLEDEVEATDELPASVRTSAAELGLFGFAIAEEYGGLGLSVTEQVQLVMELGYTMPALRSLVGTNNGIAGQVLLQGGTEEQRRAWLPRFASGDVVAAFGLTEPGAGSDPSTLTTSARRDGDEWVISGTKRFITNAPNGDVVFVFARTDPAAPPTRGIGCFLVPTGTPGLTVGPRDRKMGHAGAWSAEVVLDEVRVPYDSLMGGDAAAGSGFATAMGSLSLGRFQIAAASVGTAQRLVDEMVVYAQERHQGGGPIARFQLVQALVADSVTDLNAGRALALESARAFDAGIDRKVASSTAKYFCTEMVGRVADRAVQVHGGVGYMRGVAVERIYRDVRLFRLYEGTSQIQQVIIGKAVLGDAAREG